MFSSSSLSITKAVERIRHRRLQATGLTCALYLLPRRPYKIIEVARTHLFLGLVIEMVLDVNRRRRHRHQTVDSRHAAVPSHLLHIHHCKPLCHQKYGIQRGPQGEESPTIERFVEFENGEGERIGQIAQHRLEEPTPFQVVDHSPERAAFKCVFERFPRLKPSD